MSATPGFPDVTMADLDKWEAKLATGWRPRRESIRKLITLARVALRNQQAVELAGERLAKLRADLGPLPEVEALEPLSTEFYQALGEDES